MSDERVLAVVWLSLFRAALCLDDETVFDVEEGACPVCGGESFALLARWLQERTVADERDHARPDVAEVDRQLAPARSHGPQRGQLRLLPGGA